MAASSFIDWRKPEVSFPSTTVGVCPVVFCVNKTVSVGTSNVAGNAYCRLCDAGQYRIHGIAGNDVDRDPIHLKCARRHAETILQVRVVGSHTVERLVRVDDASN